MITKYKIGILVSTRTNKTSIVLVQQQKEHKKYKKLIKTTKRYMIHNEFNQGIVGDIVFINPCAPKSRKKRWTLAKLITKLE
jgi:small subunit ribosomal protein S17